jgi:pimeloyl-ACP methyl ester carboxylesterase
VSDLLRTLTDRFEPSVFDAPAGRARIRLVIRDEGAWDAIFDGEKLALTNAARAPRRPDALLVADRRTWQRIVSDVRGGMRAFQQGKLGVRKNLHVGVGFLAATAEDRPGRLRFGRIETKLGELAMCEAGDGPPLVLLHGLGASKAEFLPTLAALADTNRVIALDLPGFGDSDKPFPAAYDAAFFARWVDAAFDALGLDSAHVLGHSMGGRVALEFGMRYPDRTDGLILMTPSMAWLTDRKWASPLKLVRPELGILQPAPRPVVERIVYSLVPGAKNEWVRTGLDEFLRAYLTPRGRVAFYAAARQIYLEDPNGPNGFWTRLEFLASESLFIWGTRDTLVPIGFMRHVEKALPEARHVEIASGHVPQLEKPRQTHEAIADFLVRPRSRRSAAAPARTARRARPA